MGRPSARSIVMKAVWAKKKAAKLKQEVKVIEHPKVMRVRVMYYEDGIQVDSYMIVHDGWGQLADTLFKDFVIKGIKISEVLIQID